MSDDFDMEDVSIVVSREGGKGHGSECFKQPLTRWMMRQDWPTSHVTFRFQHLEM